MSKGLWNFINDYRRKTGINFGKQVGRESDNYKRKLVTKRSSIPEIYDIRYNAVQTSRNK